MRSMLKEFKEFAFKGNMLDLAVGLIIGVAFGAVVNALASGVIMNLVAAIFGKPNFDSIAWHIGRGCAAHSVRNCTAIRFGTLITALVNFMIIAFVLFLVVKAVNRAVRKPGSPVEAPTRPCTYCLSSIPAATRCMACTSTVEPPAAGPVAEQVAGG